MTPSRLPGHPAASWPAALLGLPRGSGVAAYVVLYLALDWVSLIDAFRGLAVTPWNPPAGLTLTLLLRYGWRFAPAAFAAAALSDLLLHGLSGSPATALASALVVSAGYAGAAALLRGPLGVSPGLGRSRDLIWLLAVAFVATLPVAATAVAVFAQAGLIGWSDYAASTLRFWIGDLIGIAVLTPFLLLLLEAREGDGRPAAPSARAVVERLLQFVAIVLGLWIIFGLEDTDHFELSYVLFLPLIWIALSQGLRGATWGVLATQLGLIAAIQLKGYGGDVVTQFQLLMLAVAATGLFLGGVVDERRRAEASLRESEARLQIVVGTAPDAILTLEESGEIVALNRAAERLFGVDAQAPAHHALRELLPGLEPDGLGLAGGEMAARRLDGGGFVAEVAMGEARIGSRLLRVAVVRDVTARKEAEALLEEREAELADAARLTTTGEMAAALAHELNQPLTSLIGFARACQALLQSPAGGGEAARSKAGELIERAVHQAMRAGDIIRGAREFFRRGDMRRERTEVAETFRVVHELARAQALQRRVRLAFAAADALPPLLIEPVRVQQALLNLVRNAVEAIALADPRRREVEVVARLAPDAPGFVEIAVRDSGPGIPPEVAARLFTPFMTTKETGTGLGLSISRSIVEAHGGRIWLVPADATAGGTEFRFTLPIWSEAANAA